MKVSYKWLQDYIEEPLPAVEKVVDSLTMHAFEVEGVEKKGEDSILDVKVLPNRSHDCLSHYGIAGEIASILELTRKPLLQKVKLDKTEKLAKVSISTKSCDRGVAVYITDLQVAESPSFIKERLQAVGQKPINNIVDITNYLMYSFGQPTHAFDLGKLTPNKKDSYELNIRDAKNGEKLTLLNGKEVTLASDMCVLADTEKVLDVAGVMGGLESSVTKETKEILLTLCHFDSVSVRKTSQALGLRTDASHRFENDISASLIDRVLPYALELISELADGEILGGTDTASELQKEKVLTTTKEKISSVLGIELDTETIISLLKRQGINATNNGKISVTIPTERLDLDSEESIAEEVGRIYGYEKIPVASLSDKLSVTVNPESYVVNSIRKSLTSLGFSEIYTYAFREKGDVELENPLAGDKKYLRSCLIDGMEESIMHNFKYMDLLGISEIKLFEVGKVFTHKGEFLNLCIGVKYPKSKKGINPDETLAKAVQKIEEDLGVSVGNVSVMSGLAEIDVARILKDFSVPAEYPEEFFDLEEKKVFYKTISPYPFAVRDVAVFVPVTVSENNVMDLIGKHTNANVHRVSLFDTFQKDKKTSYAFRLIFQSQEKTLTEEEINSVMNPIYEELKAQKGFEIR